MKTIRFVFMMAVFFSVSIKDKRSLGLFLDVGIDNIFDRAVEIWF